MRAFFQFLQEINLNISIIHIKFFVFANFGCNNLLVWILAVNTFDYLPKCPLVYEFLYFISVTQLLPRLCQIVAFLVGNRILIVSSYCSNGVYAVVDANLKFHLFKFGQLIAEFFHSLRNCQTLNRMICSIFLGIDSAL